MPLVLAQTVAPTAEPLTLAEAKAYLRLDTTDDDLVVEALIAMAREEVELFTERQLMPATYTLALDDFPACGIIHVPRPPLQSVTSITYLDSNGASQTLATTVYGVDTVAEPGRIYLKDDQSWPSVHPDMNAVTITYVAGWADAATVPQRAKQAMRLLIGHAFEHREAALEARTQPNEAVCRLLWGLRILQMV